jgi:hypothetical protein
MGKKTREPWIIAAQRGRLRKQLGRLSKREALNLQLISIGAEQQRQVPESQLYPKWSRDLGKAIQRFKKKGLVSATAMRFSKPQGAYSVLGLGLTEKGMKALSKAGGTVFLSPPKERR